MKKIVLIITLFTCASLSAQYYHTSLSSPGFEQAGDGATATIGGTGHLVTGVTSAFTSQGLLISRTDINGQILIPPAFSEGYDLLNSLGQPLFTQATKILELPNGNIFVTGICYEPPTPIYAPSLFTAILSPGGTPISAKSWQICSPSAGTDIYPTISACLDNNQNNVVYICGATNVLSPAPFFTPFVMSIDGNTNVDNWTGYYVAPNVRSDGLFPTDIIHSPYSASGNDELLVVGTSLDFGAVQFTFLVNSANGASIGLINQFDCGDTEFFDAVAVAPDGGGGDKGFVISGTNKYYGSHHTSAVKVDRWGANILWSYCYPYTGGSECDRTDVINRQNTSGNWEYYIATTAYQGIMGGNDMVVFKIDDNGSCLGEFTYGTTQTEQAREISIFENTGADGIGVYGNLLIANNWEAYIVKAYFNGVSGCSEYLSVASQEPYPLEVSPEDILQTGVICPSFIDFVDNGPIDERNICPVQITLPGGSNARVANETAATDEAHSVRLFPNPLNSGAMLQVQLNAPQTGEVRFTLYDITGREVFVKTIIAAQGEAQYPVEIPKDIARGMYSLRVTGAGINDQKTISVQ